MYPLIPLHSLHPRLPPGPNLRIGPLAIIPQHSRETNDPGREYDINEGDCGAEEEWPCDVGGIDEVGDGGLEGGRQGRLFGGIGGWGGEEEVEGWDDFVVDLRQDKTRQDKSVLGDHWCGGPVVWM